ncbi:MAG: hypothetical protein ACI9N1_000411 [Flavobacteriales bacterium]|jgi:hypothetical protein
MDNLDIEWGFTNYQRHPSRKNYMVVHYRKIEEAEYFQGLMEGKKYFFERDIVEDEKGPLHVFGVRIGDFNEVNELNFITIGKHKKPMIEDNAARWAVVIIGGSLILLSIIGWFLS